jgi:hypothetical protein
MAIVGAVVWPNSSAYNARAKRRLSEHAKENSTSSGEVPSRRAAAALRQRLVGRADETDAAGSGDLRDVLLSG